MKKRYWAVSLAVAAAVGAAYAADLHTPHIGSSCPEGFTGNYHFVNNQVPAGSGTGTLLATWDSGDSCSTSAYKVLTSVQHFRCAEMSGALTGASTNLGGRLVLSDFTCTRKKVCDPKYDKCE
jgi:hypothetical protein